MTSPQPYDGAGTLFALGVRATKLGPTGEPLAGDNTCYVSSALVKADIGLTYNDAQTITQTRGDGVTCVSYQAPRTVQNGSISGLQICTPDPVLLEFLMGGDVIWDTSTPPKPIGYRAPQVGVQENVDGISLEFWTRAVVGSAFAASLPYLHWVLPRAQLTPAGTWTMGAEAPMVPEFEGTTNENTAWGTGPAADWTGPSDRVWQFQRVATTPDLDAGFVTVAA